MIILALEMNLSNLNLKDRVQPTFSQTQAVYLLEVAAV